MITVEEMRKAILALNELPEEPLHHLGRRDTTFLLAIWEATAEICERLEQIRDAIERQQQ